MKLSRVANQGFMEFRELSGPSAPEAWTLKRCGGESFGSCWVEVRGGYLHARLHEPSPLLQNMGIEFAV